jgi:hypothetical protein
MHNNDSVMLVIKTSQYQNNENRVQNYQNTVTEHSFETNTTLLEHSLGKTSQYPN